MREKLQGLQAFDIFSNHVVLRLVHVVFPPQLKHTTVWPGSKPRLSFVCGHSAVVFPQEGSLIALSVKPKRIRHNKQMQPHIYC